MSSPADNLAALNIELAAARADGHRIRQRPTLSTPAGATEHQARRLARSRATSLLIDRHRGEFNQLVDGELEQARRDATVLELRRNAGQPL